MADAGGVKTIIDEARDPHHNLELAEVLGQMDGHLESVFWTFLEHLRVFEVASRFHYSDSLGRWRKRDNLPPTEAATAPDSQKRLGQAISDYYRSKEGRGHACHVDHYRRDERLYWFAYPEDYAVGRLVYDHEHQLELQTQRPAFEVIFVHSTGEGSLDIWVRGDKQVVVDLQRIFGSVVLGVDLAFEQEAGVVYQLDGLVSRDFPFALEAGDGVETVHVSRLKLRLMTWGNKRITLEANTRDEPDAIYNLLDDVLASERLSRNRLQVTAATIKVVFRPVDDARRKTLTFDVSHPDSCSLKYEPRHEVVKDLLKRWGIDVSGRTENGTEQRGRSVQRTLRV